MRICTIVARNYLAHARVLASSFREHHPDGHVDVLLLDEVDYVGDRRHEPFDVVTPYEIGLDPAEFHRMATIYSVLELATAVKPWLLRCLLDRGVDEVLYLDPDMLVLGALPDVYEKARSGSIVLTPHLLDPLEPDGRSPNETTILNVGVFNLGFIAVSAQARPFLEWWSDRLRRDCIVDIKRARFVDQRWIDLVPGMFDHVVLKDAGLNVAHWNLAQRTVTNANQMWRAGGAPLRLYHFSGFDPREPEVLSKHQGGDPRFSPTSSPALAELYAKYSRLLRDAGHDDVSALPFRFDSYADGGIIAAHTRRAYRERLLALEAQSITTPDPAPAPVGSGTQSGRPIRDLIELNQGGALNPATKLFARARIARLFGAMPRRLNTLRRRAGRVRARRAPTLER